MIRPKALLIAAACALMVSGCGHSKDRPHAKGPRGDMRAHAMAQGKVAMGDMFLFVGFDQNADYQVTVDEVQAGAARAFSRADANGDGAIAQAEYSQWAAIALGDPYASPYFMQIDSNQDRQVTQQEFLDAIYVRARQNDENQDNILTYNELRPILNVRMASAQAGERRRGQGQRRGGGGPRGGGQRGGGRF